MVFVEGIFPRLVFELQMRLSKQKDDKGFLKPPFAIRLHIELPHAFPADAPVIRVVDPTASHAWLSKDAEQRVIPKECPELWQWLPEKHVEDVVQAVVKMFSMWEPVMSPPPRVIISG
jgi:hypothetical protein